MQAALKEKATQKEVERLQTAIRNLMDEAGQRTRIEVGYAPRCGLRWSEMLIIKNLMFRI